MAKKSKEKTSDAQTELTLEYDLYSLPSVQHKAGLAGLLLMIDSMEARRKAGDRTLTHIPEVLGCTATGAKFRFTRESFRNLMCDLYAGIDIPTKKGSLRGPALGYLSGFGIDVTADGAWAKTWRDCIRAVVRKGAALGVFNKRDYAPKATEEFSGLMSTPDASEEPEASLLLACEIKNAEYVVMCGTRKNNFLLHFSLLPSLLYCPRFVVHDSETKQWRASDRLSSKRAGPFFVIVMPEPADLAAFRADATEMLRQTRSEKAAHDYRPESMLIYLPEEGGLEYLHAISHARVRKQEVSYSLHAVEVLDMEKLGKRDVRTLSRKQVHLARGLIDRYEKLRTECLNPVFRTQCMRNLLEDKQWFADFGAVFESYPEEMFVFVEGKTPSSLPVFADDVGRKFKSIRTELVMLRGGSPMNAENENNQLALRVRELILKYVARRSETSTGKKRDRADVCRDAFLAMRGRRDMDFVEYFVEAICCPPMGMNEDEYLDVSQALLSDWGKVKTLSMLALSAASWQNAGN
jgi:CRISPR-associated protein Cmx8